MIGANDAQDFLGPPDVPYTSPAVELAVRPAGGAVHADRAGAAGPRWSGSACRRCRTPGLNAQMADLNAVVQHQARAWPPVGDFLSTDKSLGTAQGGYTAVRHERRRPGRQRPHARRDAPDAGRRAGRGPAGHQRAADARLPHPLTRPARWTRTPARQACAAQSGGDAPPSGISSAGRACRAQPGTPWAHVGEPDDAGRRPARRRGSTPEPSCRAPTYLRPDAKITKVMTGRM